MTIASALTALNTDIQNARTAITNKGGTVTIDGGSSQLATDIATIPSGGSWDKFKVIDANGVLSAPENNTLDLTGLKTIPDYGMYYMFYAQAYPKNVLMSDLEEVGEYGMAYSFQNSGIESITFSDAFALHQYAMSNAFEESKIENIEVGTVEADAYCMQYLCDGNQYIKSFIADKFIQPTSFTSSSNYLRYCLRYAFRNSSIKKFIIKENTNYLHYFFQYAFDGSDLTFFSSQKGEYRNPAQSDTWSYAFRNCKNLKAITLGSSGAVRRATSMFQGCTNLIHAYLLGSNFSSANSAGLNGFNGCSKLKKIDYYSSILSSSYYAMYKTCFVGMSGLVLTMFDTNLGCSNTTATNSQFYGCNGVEVINLPVMQSQSGTGATNIFTGMTGVSEIHFNKHLENTIKALSGYSTLWGLGAGSATVYFDLISACRFSMEPNVAYYIRHGVYEGKYGLPEVAASITMNGTTYNRSESADTDLFYAFKNGNNYVYTLTPNPCETEPVYNINEQEIGTVTSSEIFYMFYTGSSNVSSPVYYTKTGIHGAIGDAAYTKDSEGGMTEVGTITLDSAG